MRLKRLFTGVIGVAGVCLLGGLPAKATARLQAWEFDIGQNRLLFTTEGGVEPQVSLLPHPRRLVIDLPGILADAALTDQLVGGAVESVRVLQIDAHTTRMELALDPAYVLDPKQVKVWGMTSQQWVVQLPSATQSAEAQAAFAASPLTVPDFSKAAVRPLAPVGDNPLPPRLSPNVIDRNGRNGRNGRNVIDRSKADSTYLSRNQVTPAAVQATATVLHGVQATNEGFFIPTAGAAPQVQVYRTRDGNQMRQLVIDLLDAAIDPGLTAEALPQGRYGIHRWSLTQFATAPPAIRITLTLDHHSPDWQITPLASGGIWVMPIGVTPSQIAAPPTTVVLPVVSSGAPPPMDRPVAPPVSSAPAVAQVPRREQVLVMLDPGHGGRDPGAVGIGGLQEKGVVLAVSHHVAAALQAQGVAVQMTRQSDQTVDLGPRADMATAAGATVFVSIHANAVNMQRPEVNGLETYYYSEAGRVLATALQNQVLSTMAMNDRGVRQARFLVLRRTAMPAALIEIGFVTGVIDAPKLRDPRWQAQMGQAIAQGILNYLNGRP